jgi:hypothetical protein
MEIGKGKNRLSMEPSKHPDTNGKNILPDRHRTIVLIAAGALLLFFFLFFFFVDSLSLGSASPLFSSQDPWRIRGEVRSVLPLNDLSDALPPPIIRHPELRFWELSSAPEKKSGEILSPRFVPGRFIGVPLFFDSVLDQSCLALYRVDTGEKWEPPLPLSKGWHLAVIELPVSFRNRPVELYAVNTRRDTSSRLVVGTPFAVGTVAGFQHKFLPILLPAGFVVILSLCGILFLVTGAAMVLSFGRGVDIPGDMTLLFAYGGAALLGYGVFWIYFAGAALGQVASWLLIAGALVLLLHRKTKPRLYRMVKAPDTLLPVCLIFLAVLFYLAAIYMYHPQPWNGGWTRTVFHRMGHAGDNLIPRIMADRLATGKDLLKPISTDWQGSDRPPLQAGMVLMQYPLWRALSHRALIRDLVDLYYQIFATLLQCAWIAALWPFFRGCGLSQNRSFAVILVLIPSGFFFFNSVFVWPKMLAGSLAAGSFLLLLPRHIPDRHAPGQVLAAAVFGALAFLGHGGAAFALLGLGIVLLFPRYFPGWRLVALGIGLFLILNAPWALYQRFFDPPGNRLVKWHLAGAVAPDHRSALEAISDYYGNMRLSDFLSQKAEFIKTVAGFHTRTGWPRDRTPDRLRRLQFWGVLPALGMLNAGWIFFFAGLRRKDRQSSSAIRIISVSLFCLLLWVLILASEAAIIHGPYTVVMLLFAGLAALIAARPWWIAGPIFFLQAAGSLLLWVAMGDNTGLTIWWADYLDLPVFRFDPVMTLAAGLFYLSPWVWLWAFSRFPKGKSASS